MKSSDFRKQAREVLTNNWWKGVAITAAYSLILIAVEILLSLTNRIPLFNLLIAIGNVVISVPISYGLFSSFMKLKRKEEVKAFDFLKDGFSNFGKAWAIMGHIILKLLIPIIIMIVLYFIIAYCISALFISALITQTLSVLPFIVLILSLIGFLGVSFWLTIKYLFYAFVYPIAYDNPDMKAKDVVLTSKELMTNNRWKYFVLSLTFIGWILLATIPFGIGLLWVLPYMQVAQICFYEYLCSSNEQN